jgi:hypothetical protein
MNVCARTVSAATSCPGTGHKLVDVLWVEPDFHHNLSAVTGAQQNVAHVGAPVQGQSVAVGARGASTGARAGLLLIHVQHRVELPPELVDRRGVFNIDTTIDKAKPQ